jgi:hypothetical protein
MRGSGKTLGNRFRPKEFAMRLTWPIAFLAWVALLTISRPLSLLGQAPKRFVSPEVQADAKVTFRLSAPKAEKVVLNSGEMQPVLKAPSTSLTKGEDGVWSVTVGPLPPGIYDYTFNIDGVSITDPSSPNVFGNRQGSRGFVEVPGPKGQPRHDEWRDVPHGAVTIHWYDSKASGTRRRVHVYTPPGYGKELERRYPVLYLLHGSGDIERAVCGRCSLMCRPGSEVAMGRNSPRISVGASGFRSNMS